MEIYFSSPGTYSLSSCSLGFCLPSQAGLRFLTASGGDWLA